MWDNVELAKASKSFRFNKSNLKKGTPVIGTVKANK